MSENEYEYEYEEDVNNTNEYEDVNEYEIEEEDVNEQNTIEEEDTNEEEDENEQQQTKKSTKPKGISKDAKTLYKQYNTKYQPLLQYPFKSKVQYVEQYIQDRQEPFVHDFQLKPVKKLSKPNFSRTPGCWEL